MDNTEILNRTRKATALARTLVEAGGVTALLNVEETVALPAVRSLLLAHTPRPPRHPRASERRWDAASEETWAMVAVIAETLLAVRS